MVAVNMRKAFRDDGLTGTTSGLIDMDEKLGGFRTPTCLFWRSSVDGKTALALPAAYNAAKAYADSGGRRAQSRRSFIKCHLTSSPGVFWR